MAINWMEDFTRLIFSVLLLQDLLGMEENVSQKIEEILAEDRYRYVDLFRFSFLFLGLSCIKNFKILHGWRK